jgi:hypothetical protein
VVGRGLARHGQKASHGSTQPRRRSDKDRRGFSRKKAQKAQKEDRRARAEFKSNLLSSSWFSFAPFVLFCGFILFVSDPRLSALIRGCLLSSAFLLSPDH